MSSNSSNDSVFIVVSLFLLSIIALMLIIQLIIWLIFTKKKSKIPSNFKNKSYDILLAKEQYDGTIKKVKFIFKFNKYDQKNNILKLKKKDFEEKTIWNVYQNLISILLVKWKKTNQKTNIALITSTLIFYFSTIMTIICALIYYLNLGQNTLDSINTTALSISSFIALMFLVLSWLIWTMAYEKLRKEIIKLASTLEDVTLIKTIKVISGYKTLFPSSELLF